MKQIECCNADLTGITIPAASTDPQVYRRRSEPRIRDLSRVKRTVRNGDRTRMLGSPSEAGKPYKMVLSMTIKEKLWATIINTKAPLT